MPLLTRGGRAWHLLALAVVAVPWFLRDHLAVTLEAQTQAAQDVLHGLATERDRQAAEREQRDLRQRLERIELLLQKVAGESSNADHAAQRREAWQASVNEEADALRTAVEVFDGLVADAEPSEATRNTASEAAASARAAADQLVQQLRGASEAQAAELFDPFDSAAQQLEDAFEAVHKEAAERSESTAGQANLSRLLAWLLTGLGALMVGGGGLLTKDKGSDANAATAS